MAIESESTQNKLEKWDGTENDSFPNKVISRKREVALTCPSFQYILINISQRTKNVASVLVIRPQYGSIVRVLVVPGTSTGTRKKSQTAERSEIRDPRIKILQ
jgi:hypothetical protein